MAKTFNALCGKNLRLDIKTSTLIATFKLKESIRYDFVKLKVIIVLFIALIVHTLKCFGFHCHAINYLGRLFNSGWLMADRIATKLFSQYLSNPRSKVILGTLLVNHTNNIKPSPKTNKFFASPKQYFPHMCIVLKTATEAEKGVILLNYSYCFPLFVKLFSIDDVLTRYYIVLEPSWSGYFDKDILCYMNFNQPIFVEAPEPRDYKFISDLRSNLIPVALGANWWIDSRKFTPLADVNRDVDIIMVSAWASYKRHFSVFNTIRKLKEKQIVLKVVLIGYQMDLDIDSIQHLARYYDIVDQVECYESLTQEEVNYHFNRSKINLLWSRFEGINRSIIEGMYANVPCILRRAFNYGYNYPYINDSTGAFADESDLEQTILHMLYNGANYSPRQWVLEHMSLEAGIAVLEEVIKKYSRSSNDAWSGGVVRKINALHGTYYWDESDYVKFQKDYEILESFIKQS